MKLTLESVRLMHAGSKNVASLPFTLPEGVSLADFLASSSDQLTSCFPFGSEGNEAMKNIDIGGVTMPATIKMAANSYKKLATHFSNHDTGWSRKLSRAMEKIRTKNGGEEWVSVRNLESFCEANEDLEVEVVVTPSIPRCNIRRSGDATPASFDSDSPTMPPDTPASLAGVAGAVAFPTPRQPTPPPSDAPGFSSSFARGSAGDVMSLRFEVAQLRSDVADLRMELREGIAQLLEAMRGQ